MDRHGTLRPVFHVELRQFPHQARAFNLTSEELRARISAPWVAGETVECGDRRWAPERAKLTIFEGPQLRPDEIGLGRGWANATRGGVEVTASILADAQAQAQHALGESAGQTEPSALELEEEILDACAAGRIGVHEALSLASERHPGMRVSERLALAERSVWELLHHGRVRMVRRVAADGGSRWDVVAKREWDAVLLAWATWADPLGAGVLLEAVERR